MTHTILRLPAVKTITGLSRSTIYLRITQQEFTRPVTLGARAVGWPAHEVAALNAARIAGKARRGNSRARGEAGSRSCGNRVGRCVHAQTPLWGSDDPLFPATRIALGANKQFEVVGLDRKQWSNAGPIRTIFREAFEQADLPYFNPHSLRKTLSHLGEQVCKTPEEFKAWSQNLGHEQVLTTFMSYGTVREDRQGEIIRKLRGARESKQPDAEVMLKALLEQVQSGGFGSSAG